jgi:L-fucose isomerase-like protein
MKVLVIRSSFQSDGFVNTEYAELFGLLKKECDAEITILGEESGWSWLITSIQSIDFVMVATGGVENLFKKIWSTGMLKTTTLIADGRNNSLAAALEILSFLSENGFEGRIIHGSNEEMARNVKETYQETYNQLKDSWRPASLRGTRIGLFGKPSDWLIASGVDYDYLREYYGIQTVLIDLERLIDGINDVDAAGAEVVAKDLEQRSKSVKEPSYNDIIEAAKTYIAIKKICQEERLDAMTIRCFDIVKACNTTSCLALAKLNDEGIVAGCEGDMQTLMTMLLAKKLCNETAFMANPSILTDKTAMLAHCTVPLSMCESTIVRSHFESGLGVAVQGDLPLTDYTIMKWGGRRLDKMFVTEAKAIKNEYSNHFCRTQITFDVNLKPYLLSHSIGNHHVIIKGRHAAEIRRFMKENGIDTI